MSSGSSGSTGPVGSGADNSDAHELAARTSGARTSSPRPSGARGSAARGSAPFAGFDPDAVPSPSFVIDERAIEDNLAVLGEVQERSGAVILMALKAFALPAVFPRVAEVLSGVCASGPYEARLGKECHGGAVHTFSPAYSPDDLEEVLALSDHVVFNSPSQWLRYRERCRESRCEFGLRVNPEHSEAEPAIYDPCAPYSRLGTTERALRTALAETPGLLEGITTLHMHTLCEQGSEALERTVAALEQRFGEWLPHMHRLNLGGGHHITKPEYDRERLIALVKRLRETYDLEVYLEPGEAIVLGSGVLVATVLDVIENGMQIAILDASATAHMPDVLEMPYRPEIRGGGMPGERAHTYRLGGPTCLAGDVVGDYSFNEPLTPGDRLVFEDMAHYTFVKTTMFNGVPHPALALYHSGTRRLRVLRRFGYHDFLTRLS